MHLYISNEMKKLGIEHLLHPYYTLQVYFFALFRSLRLATVHIYF